MTVSMTPTGEHMSEATSRALVDSLLDEDEQTSLKDAIAMETDDPEDDANEMVTGWRSSNSISKVGTTTSKRVGSYRKKGSKQFPPDIDMDNIRVRCVSDDYTGDHQMPSWKANVEPGTYRYISNNGIYRSSKFANAGSDWVTAKRSRQSKPNAVLTPEMRQAHKTLKKDLSEMLKPSTESAKAAVEMKGHELAHRPTSRSSSPTVIQRDLDTSSGIPFTKEYTKNPNLVKSAFDLFVENFSNRMSALQKLEKEMQSSNHRPMITSAKPGGNSSSSALNRHNASGKRHHQHSDKNNSNNNNNSETDVTKYLEQQQAEGIAKDVFIIKPVTRASEPLRPLEKITAQQKSLEGLNDCSSSHRSKNGPDSPTLPTSFMSAMNVFSQLQHEQEQEQQHLDQETHSKSPSTFIIYHKNSLGATSAGSFIDMDSLSSVRNALTLTNSNIERMRLRPYGKDFTVKDYGRFLTGKSKLGTSLTTTKNTTTFRQTIGGHRKGVVGYKPMSNVASVTSLPSRLAPSVNHVPATSVLNDVSSNVSDTSDLYVSGGSVKVGRGSGILQDAKSSDMALPEISGKRLAVTMSTQRLL